MTTQPQPAHVADNTSPAGETQAGTSPVTWEDGSPFDPERAQRTIMAQRDDIRKLKEARDSLSAEIAKLKEADDERRTSEMSEVEKLKAKLDRLTTELEMAVGVARESRLKVAFQVSAQKQGIKFVSPEAMLDAFRLADFSKVDVTMGTSDDDLIGSVGDVLKSLVQTRSYLFETSGDSRNRPPAPTPAPAIDGGRRGGRQSTNRMELIEAKRKSGMYNPL